MYIITHAVYLSACTSAPVDFSLKVEARLSFLEIIPSIIRALGNSDTSDSLFLAPSDLAHSFVLSAEKSMKARITYIRTRRYAYIHIFVYTSRSGNRVRQRFYVEPERSRALALVSIGQRRWRAPVVVKQLYGVVGRAQSIFHQFHCHCRAIPRVMIIVCRPRVQ